MKKLFFTFFLVFLCISPVCSAKITVKANTEYILSSLSSIAFTMQREYYNDISNDSLYSGAMSEIAMNRKNVAGVKVKNQNDFENFFRSYSAAHPEDAGAVGELAVRGMLRSLKDPYALFFDTAQWDYFKKMISGREFTGVGVELANIDSELVIVAPIQGSPAAKAGIRAGDIIKSVAGVDIAKLDEVEILNLFNGPSGTALALEVERKGKRYKYRIIRDSISLPPPKGSILKAGKASIGYIKISYFGALTDKEVAVFLDKFSDSGIKNLLIDLRDNPGGDLKSALRLASFFTGNAVNVKIKKRGLPLQDIRGTEAARYNFNTFILVNRGSASASEIFASALRENRKALLAGNKTFGKALIQSVFALPGNAGCRFTTSKYFTSAGKDILYKGILPDIVVSEDGRGEKLSSDTVVKAAVDALTRGTKYKL